MSLWNETCFRRFRRGFFENDGVNSELANMSHGDRNVQEAPPVSAYLRGGSVGAVKDFDFMKLRSSFHHRTVLPQR